MGLLRKTEAIHDVLENNIHTCVQSQKVILQTLAALSPEKYGSWDSSFVTFLFRFSTSTAFHLALSVSLRSFSPPFALPSHCAC